MTYVWKHEVPDENLDFTLVNESIAVYVEFFEQGFEYLIRINVRMAHGCQGVLAEFPHFFVVQGAIIVGIVDLPHVFNNWVDGHLLVHARDASHQLFHTVFLGNLLLLFLAQHLELRVSSYDFWRVYRLWFELLGKFEFGSNRRFWLACFQRVLYWT